MPSFLDVRCKRLLLPCNSFVAQRFVAAWHGWALGEARSWRIYTNPFAAWATLKSKVELNPIGWDRVPFLCNRYFLAHVADDPSPPKTQEFGFPLHEGFCIWTIQNEGSMYHHLPVYCPLPTIQTEPCTNGVNPPKVMIGSLRSMALTVII